MPTESRPPPTSSDDLTELFVRDTDGEPDRWVRPVHVLLVEDDPATARLVEELIGGENGATVYHVDPVETLAETLDRLTLGGHDVCLLDLGLPDASGLEAVEAVHDAAPGLPVVVLTGRDDEALAREAIRAHAEDYLGKNRVDGLAIRQAIRHAIDRHRLRVDLSLRLRASEARFRHLVKVVPVGILIVETGGTVRFVNAEAARLLDRPGASLQGEPYDGPVEPGSSYRIQVEGGRHVQAQVARIRWGGEEARLVSLRDVTEQRVKEAHLLRETQGLGTANRFLLHEVRTDPLTELPNRRAARETLRAEANRARRSGSTLSAILCDVDDFKGVNDRYGHAAGDAALRRVSRRLTGGVRPWDEVSRIGGDEYLVILPDTRLEQGLRVAERLRRAVADEVVRVDDGEVPVSLSLAVAPVDLDEPTVEAVLTRTHRALRHCKTTGKDCVVSWKGDTLARTDEALPILEEVLERPELLKVVHQPILRLDDRAVAGAELLCRGPGLLRPPETLFRVARENDVLEELDRICLASATRAAGDLPTRVHHLNVFPDTLVASPAEELVDLLRPEEAGVTRVLEVSAGDLGGDPDRVRAALTPLRRAGVHLALDGLDRTREALEALLCLEPEVAKIAGVCVRGAPGHTERTATLERLVRAGKALGCRVVAAGIETEEELELVRQVGAPYGQGFLLGRPA